MKRLFCLLLAALLLAGCANTGGNEETTVFTLDYAVTPVEEIGTAEEILAARRQIVVDEMRRMMSILWTPTQNLTYDLGDGANPENSYDTGEVKLFAGNIYQGIPYTHGAGSGYSFLSYAVAQDENGVYTIDGLTANSLSGAGGPASIGNDCADAVLWAWARVSNSITFTFTRDMTEKFGCLKVGEYAFDLPSYKGVQSADICEENGEQVMFASYAQMLPGDAMVRRVKTAGHAIMNISVNVVYKEDGTIDGEASTAVILDQSSDCEKAFNSYEHETLGTVYLCEYPEREKTFAWLFSMGYLPLTCQELIDPAPLEKPAVTDCTESPTVENMFTGSLETNYLPSSVTVTIYDSKDAAVQTATCYSEQPEMYTFNLQRFTDELWQKVLKGGIDLALLEKGTYRCVFECRLSTGDNITVRDFTFQK